jgi:hypothetical protein
MSSAPPSRRDDSAPEQRESPACNARISTGFYAFVVLAVLIGAVVFVLIRVI